MRKLFAIFYCCISFTFFAQKSIEDGNYYYDRKAYAKAIELFEPIFEANPTQEMALKIANSHYQIRNLQKSMEYYEKANDIKPLNEEQSLKYIDILKENGQSQTARTFAKEKLSGRSKTMLASFDTLQAWSSKSPAYSVTNLSLNSSSNDFGIANFKGSERIFYSDRPEQNSSTLLSTTNNNNFLDMYLFNLKDTLESSPRLKKFTLKTGKFHDATAFYDAVNDKLYFTRNYNNANRLIPNKSNMSNLKILTADVDSSYNLVNIKDFKYNNPDYSVGHPCLSRNGNYLYFVSDMPLGKGGTDIYVCHKLANGDWDFPVNLGSEINTSRNEMFPYISPTNELIFSSNGHVGFGGLDIFKATEQRDGKFGKPYNFGAVINSNYDDFALTFNDVSQKSGFLSSNRQGGKGGDDIYSFMKLNSENKCKQKDFKVTVIDHKTKARLSGAVLAMIDITAMDTLFGVTDENGEYIFKVCSNKDYNLNVKRNLYLTNSFTDADVTKDGYTASLYKKEVNNLVEIKNIYYEFDKADIHPSATPQLDRLSILLMQNPDVKVELSSHTDSRGKDEYNLELSQKRAENVVKFLHFMGIETNRMIAKGYGEMRLINHCGNNVNCLEEEHVQNRRTEFRIVDIMNMSSIMSQNDPKQALQVVHVTDRMNADQYKPASNSMTEINTQPTLSRMKIESIIDHENEKSTAVNTESNKMNIRLPQESASTPISKMRIESDIPDPDNVKQPSYNDNAIKNKKPAGYISDRMNSSNPNSYFSIQLGSFSSPKSLSSFARLEAVHMIPDNNRYIALSGKFNSLSEAENYKPIARQYIPGAFLVRIVDGKKMALK